MVLAEKEFADAKQLINDGHNGLITHIMATMSADKYNETKSNKSIPKKSLLGDAAMKYKNKTIFKNPKAKTWYARYRLNGKQYYIAGKTQEEVYNKLKIELNLTKKDNITIFTLKTWIEKWFSLYKSNLRERSILDLKNTLNKVYSTLMSRKIESINSIELNEYIQSLSSERVRAKTYVILNDIFDKATKNGVINKNPFDVIQKPKYEPKERYALSLSEENLLLDKIKNKEEYYIFAIAMLQGLRPGELLALEYRDINFKNMTITINKSYDEKTSDTEVKNKYSNRTVPLFKKTYEIIKNIDTGLCRRFAQHNTKTLNSQLKDLTNDITNEEITLYNLRHTLITRLSDNNVPEHIIQAWVGHSKGSKITKTTYTHISKETEIKYINILNA